jgi:hypothetical protein
VCVAYGPLIVGHLMIKFFGVSIGPGWPATNGKNFIRPRIIAVFNSSHRRPTPGAVGCCPRSLSQTHVCGDWVRSAATAHSQPLPNLSPGPARRGSCRESDSEWAGPAQLEATMALDLGRADPPAYRVPRARRAGEDRDQQDSDTGTGRPSHRDRRAVTESRRRAVARAACHWRAGAVRAVPGHLEPCQTSISRFGTLI